MKNAWLVRPAPHGVVRIDEFRRGKFIAIGWPGIGDIGGCSREDLKAILARPPYNHSSLELGNAYATIDIFVNQMSVGDLCLVPNGDDIYFCKITSPYYFAAEFDADNLGYSHQRTVEWTTSVSRKGLPMDLRSSLKVHRTTANLTKHYAEIEALANGYAIPAEHEKQSAVIDVSYPLRLDFAVEMQVPADMSKSEAERLSVYLRTLYFSE